MKKIFIVSVVLLVIMLIFLGIYNFAFKKKQNVDTKVAAEPITTSVVSNTASLKNKKISLISEGSVVGVIEDRKTEEIKYYDATTGLVWKTDADGKGKVQITDTKIAGIKNAVWSPDNNKVLTEIRKDGLSSFYMYDHKAQKGSLLKNGLDTVVWDNIGAKIFYKYYDTILNQRSLNIANPDGGGWQKLTDITARNLVIAPVPRTSTVSFWNNPNAYEETQLQIIGVAGGEQKNIYSGKFGADYLWSPDGSKALVSSLPSKESKNIMLGVLTIEGEYHDLSIPTIVSKCAWSNDSKTVYYALPGEIPADAVMPNDYQDNKFNTKDTFWKMNISTGEKERIVETADIDGEYDLTNPFLSPTEDALYFINKSDQKLYKITL